MFVIKLSHALWTMYFPHLFYSYSQQHCPDKKIFVEVRWIYVAQVSQYLEKRK